MKKLIFIMVLIQISIHSTLFAMQPGVKIVEELIVDNKMVMIRDTNAKDHFFFIDNIVYIEKDNKAKKYTIGLTNGKIITLYKLDNYRKIMKTFFNMKDYSNNKNSNIAKNQSGKQINGNNPSVVNSKGTPYVSNSANEQREIDKMNIGSQEQIIALDPLDIIEH